MSLDENKTSITTLLQSWRNYKLFLFILCSLVYFSCGRMSAPIAPEKTSPKFIEGFSINPVSGNPVPATGKTKLEWFVPTRDQRNEKLKELYGYKIYRLIMDPADFNEGCLTIVPPPAGPVPDPTALATITPTATPTDTPMPASDEERIAREKVCSDLHTTLKKKNFELIQEIPDTAIFALQERKRVARENNVLSRKLSLTDEEKKITFEDQINKNKIYIYSIVPYNSSFVELDPDILNFVFNNTESGIFFKQYQNPQYEEIDSSNADSYFDSAEEE